MNLAPSSSLDDTAQASFTMAIITTLLGGLGLVATASNHPVHAARLEWWGGLLLVVSLVGLGFDLAQASS